MPVPRAALISISTSRSAGAAADRSREALERFAATVGVQVHAFEMTPDDRGRIEELLRRYSDEQACELILTSGGTGMSPSDVTPEATLAVIERHVPGIGEALREASRPHTPNWMLSRAQAGIRGATLIVNFPGNPASIEQAGAVIAPALGHALALIAGRPSGHAPAAESGPGG
jgi:molybdopterin adenylyltransferase